MKQAVHFCLYYLHCSLAFLKVDVIHHVVINVLSAVFDRDALYFLRICYAQELLFIRIKQLNILKKRQ